MFEVTDEHIDFMYSDIRARGVVTEDLQCNIIDHVCCLAEHKLKHSDNFYRFYESIIPKFFDKKLKELQEETDLLLTSKILYQMKNLLKYTGILSVILLLLGVAFKMTHTVGAGIILVLGAVLFAFVFLPTTIALKYKDQDSLDNKLLTTVGFLIAMVATVSCLFKVMHWPYANMLRVSSVVVFLVVFVPLYYYVKNKKAETKFNALMNTMMMAASGILLFAMTMSL